MRRLLDAGEIDLALIKREAGDGACLASWKEELVWVGGVSCKVDPDPVSLAVFPVGCIYRERAIRAIEAQGRRWRIAYTSQGLMGVQAAVASGLGPPLIERASIHRRRRVLLAPCSPLTLAVLSATSSASFAAVNLRLASSSRFMALSYFGTLTIMSESRPALGCNVTFKNKDLQPTKSDLYDVNQFQPANPFL